MRSDRPTLSCPGCGSPMRIARLIARFRDFSELQTFECGRCDLAFTGEAVSEALEFAAQTVAA
jgi:hypothetical protein